MIAREKAANNPPAADTVLILAAAAALVTLLPVAAHQLGALDHLPDPPSAIFASDKITSSSMAHPLGIPDSLLGIASYGATLGLALLARKHPHARRLLTLKLAADGSLATFNLIRQVVTFRKLCSWCTATGICTAAMVFAGRRDH